MNILLDTHIFQWYITEDARLSTDFVDAIRDSQNSVYLSSASIWESSIKFQLGKLPLPDSSAQLLPQECMTHDIDILPIDEVAILHLESLPPLHRDPFDRVIIAQALQHNLILATVDSQVLAYNAPFFP